MHCLAINTRSSGSYVRMLAVHSSLAAQAKRVSVHSDVNLPLIIIIIIIIEHEAEHNAELAQPPRCHPQHTEAICNAGHRLTDEHGAVLLTMHTTSTCGWCYKFAVVVAAVVVGASLCRRCSTQSGCGGRVSEGARAYSASTHRFEPRRPYREQGSGEP